MVEDAFSNWATIRLVGACRCRTRAHCRNRAPNSQPIAEL